MAREYELKALIVAVDKLSPTLRQINKSLNYTRNQLKMFGRDAPMVGASFAAALALPAKAFMDLESSTVNLQNALMDKNGAIPKIFEAIAAESIKLGNQLPGSTEDFNKMASALKSLGVAPEKIAGGALRATAYLGVVGKEVGVTYETASESIGKLSRAFNIAGDDLVPFADSMQRALFMGMKLEDMQYAMSRISGSLAVVGQQGLNVANDVLPLVSVLTGLGMSGEEAGTGLREIINTASQAGKFKSIHQLVADLDKINQLPAAQRNVRLNKLFGIHASKAAMITLESYNRQLQMMADQGSLMNKIANSAESLSNKVETAGGTWTNFMAVFAKTYSPQMKAMADQLNAISERLSGFVIANGEGIMTLIKMAGAFTGLKIAAWAAAGGIGVLTTAMKLNPWLMWAQALVVAAPLIIDNLDNIRNAVNDTAKSLVNMLKQINDNETLKAIGSVPLYIGRSIGRLLPDLPDLSASVGEGMRPPGYQRPNIVGSHRVTGAIDVNFNNTPAGTRVVPSSSGPVAVNPNVGYRTVGTMLP